MSNVGLNAGTYSSSSAMYSTMKRAGSVVAPLTMSANDVVINGLAVSAPLAISDTSTQATTTSATKASSAIAMASAINAVSSSTHVTAVANPNVVVGTGFQAGNVDSIYLNGVTIGVNLSSTSSAMWSLFSIKKQVKLV